MARDLIPSSFWRFPRFPSIMDEDWDFPSVFGEGSSGLSISEDENQVYVEAQVPGVEADDVQLTFDRGVLRLKAEKKTEEKNKKYYRKAASSFSYQVAVPGEIDENQEPEASYKNGVMKVAFKKAKKAKPKTIKVKKE